MDTISEIITSWDKLTLDDKEYTLELMQKEIIDSKREILLDRVKEAEANYLLGQIHSGSVEDLFKELEDD